MLSEKTVELNLTTELINWFGQLTSRPHYALAPTARAEGKLGFDVSLRGPGTGVLLQFKRAHWDGAHIKWELNRTRLQDQHDRLQKLEARGIPVFYALPMFWFAWQLAHHRRRLLKHTAWIRPSLIVPLGGPTGHHDVLFDPATGVWTVHSPAGAPLGGVGAVVEVVRALLSEQNQGNAERALQTANEIVFEASMTEPDDAPPSERRDELGDLGDGLCALAHAQFPPPIPRPWM